MLDKAGADELTKRFVGVTAGNRRLYALRHIIKAYLAELAERRGEISAEVDRIDYAVVGIGINANVDVSGFPLEWKSTSLSRELGRDVSRVELIQKILQEIDSIFGGMDFKDLYREWCDRSATLGKMVRVTSGGGDVVGQAVELSSDGALIVASKGTSVRMLAGDCIHLREI